MLPNGEVDEQLLWVDRCTGFTNEGVTSMLVWVNQNCPVSRMDI